MLFRSLTAALKASGLQGVDGDGDTCFDDETARLERWLDQAKGISDSGFVKSCPLAAAALKVEIGRASCRERV